MTTNIFAYTADYKLICLTAFENEEVKVPAGSTLSHSEPIFEETEHGEQTISGMYLWFLVPADSMEQVDMELEEFPDGVDF